MSPRRVTLTAVAALYFVVVIGLAFVPGSVLNRMSWLGSVGPFVPVGILLLLLLGPRRWWAAIAFAALGAAWIEAGQSVWMPAGFAEAGDVALGTLGAAFGVAVATVLASRRSRTVRSDDSHRIVPQAGSKEIP